MFEVHALACIVLNYVPLEASTSFYRQILFIKLKLFSTQLSTIEVILMDIKEVVRLANDSKLPDDDKQAILIFNEKLEF